MLKSPRPRRSLLYMPGSNARALEKARSLPADGFIFDLEDSVAPEAKETARRQVMEVLTAGGYGRRETIVRVNGLATPWGAEDLAAAALSGADAVLLPKVESLADLRAAEEVLADAGAPRRQALMCMLETPRGILKAEEIAGGSRRLAALILGTSDLAKELGARPHGERLPLIASLSLVLLAGRAHGLAVIDGVHLDLADEAGFEAECRQGRDLGFDGKTLIHPKTIEVANRIFAPTPEELAEARRILEAQAAARAAGQGVAVLDGRLVEALHAEAARRRIELAEAIAALESPTS